MAKTDAEIRELRERAWLGDAVLALFAREWVLRERGSMDGDWFTRMTSNGFLASFGNPTAVEANIGALYRQGGLPAAFAWIEAELVPAFRKRVATKSPAH